jgi:CRP-like cAMP-binding protein
MEKKVLQTLALCPLFQGLSLEEIDGIFSSTNYRLVDFAAKDIYTLAEMPCRYADIIVEGSMVARMTGLSGKIVQIDRLPKATLVAPAFIFAQRNAMPVSVETCEPTRVLRMMPSELQKLLDTYPQIRINFIRLLSNIDVFLSQKLRMLSLFTVREKVAYFLVKAAEHQQSRTITLDKSRQEIADMFGIQKFSLLRCLSEFVANGAIKIEGRQITILNSDKMR